jgi:hypothetical protein
LIIPDWRIDGNRDGNILRIVLRVRFVRLQKHPTDHAVRRVFAYLRMVFHDVLNSILPPIYFEVVIFCSRGFVAELWSLLAI